MNSKMLLSSLVLASGLVFTCGLLAQTPKVDFPAPSPACTLKQHVGLTDIEIVYSRPGVKGRPIFGGLVPYGQVWRTGANNATKITFSTPVKLNGAEIPAGTYALFTIPGETEWTIIINKGAAQWGAFQYNETNDLVRVKATPLKLAEPVETFTIEINDIRDESATLNLTWEKTRVPVKLEVELVSKLVPQIEAVMSAAEGRKPYYQAALFYYDHGQDLQKASKWVDAAIAEREAYYIVNLKARILAKLGDKEGAIAAAKRSTELAIKAKDTGYVKLNEDLISSLK
ncbi:MAG: DUF2911 domain-containing protein [Verrucomicrobiota bacterium]|jgi:hypothetical protein